MLVKEGKAAWSIKKSLAASGAHIQGGRVTNSPTSPEAGRSIQDGVQKWRYSDGVWKEGAISITCCDLLAHLGSIVFIDEFLYHNQNLPCC